MIPGFVGKTSRLLSQQAGPKLPTYMAGNPTTTAAVHFAHSSRRLKIRIASQTQNAANATARVGAR